MISGGSRILTASQRLNILNRFVSFWQTLREIVHVRYFISECDLGGGANSESITVGWFGGSGPTLMKTVEYFAQLKFYPLGGI